MALSVDQTLLKAKKLARNGATAEAAELYQAILRKFPANKRAQRGLAALEAPPGKKASQVAAQHENALIGLFNQGRFQEVVAQATTLVERFPDSCILFSILGAANAGLGFLDAAVESYNRAIRIDPAYADAHNNLGAALNDRGDSAAAIESYRCAIKLNPHYAEAHNNLGNALADAGDAAAAIASYRRAIEIRPDYAAAHKNLGNTHLKSGDPTAAIRPYRRVIEINPRHAEAHKDLGDALQATGDSVPAVESYKRAIEIRPDYAEAHNALGKTLNRGGNPAAAIKCHVRALEIDPAYAEAHIGLGNALHVTGDLEAAADSYRRALAIAPDLAEAHFGLGNVLNTKGDRIAARESIVQALRIRPDYAECYLIYTTTGAAAPDDPLIPQLRSLLGAGNLAARDEANLRFALAKVEEDLGNDEGCIDNLVRGNGLMKRTLSYDIFSDEELCASIKRYFDTDRGNDTTDTGDTPSESASRPVFIVGMPRSGTTLLEQIVSSHSSVFGAGEIQFLNNAVHEFWWRSQDDRTQVFHNIRAFYRRNLAELSAAPVITDKTPQNFRWIGFILNALPEAKIVHIERDPAAVCWSNWKRLFESTGMSFTYDLQDVARYYRLYENLMAFWHEKYPGRVYDLSYEALTENQEAETRKLLDYLGLPWEDDVLEFHRNRRAVLTASSGQVRQEMYKGSSTEWKRFENWLEPMLAILNVDAAAHRHSRDAPEELLLGAAR